MWKWIIAFVYLCFIPVWACMRARGCILRKHTSECMLVLSGRDVCVRTVDWGLAWLPGWLANRERNWHMLILWRCMLRKNTGKHTARVKTQWKGERACEEDTKEAFTHSGFQFAVKGTSAADARVHLNSNLIAQDIVRLLLKPHSACFYNYVGKSFISLQLACIGLFSSAECRWMRTILQ